MPHERLDPAAGETWGWVPDFTPSDGPRRLAPARPADRAAVRRARAPCAARSPSTCPSDGKRPDAAQRRLLQTYAEQAGRAVITALEREALADQVRLAEAARQVVRTASAQLQPRRAILADCREALVEGFQAHGMWIQTFDEDGRGTGAIHSSRRHRDHPPDELVGIAESAARRAWAIQRVEIVAARPPVRRHDHSPSRAS